MSILLPNPAVLPGTVTDGITDRPGTEQPARTDRASSAAPVNGKRRLNRCGSCDRRWSGLAVCHCSMCHRHFAGKSAFDRHRRGPDQARRCLDPATMPIFVGRERSFGLVWSQRCDRSW